MSNALWVYVGFGATVIASVVLLLILEERNK